MINKELNELLLASPVFDGLDTVIAGFDKNTPEGRYNVDGDNIFLLVSRYTTLSEEQILMESHQKYSEIHLLLEGSEELGYCQTAVLIPHMPYDEHKDIEFWQKPTTYPKAVIDAKKAVFFNCGEAHAPRIAIGGKPQPVMKIVIKFKKEVLSVI